ncbi:MAG: hypothetical protein V4653_17670 [Pseudomonadota bacterium]
MRGIMIWVGAMLAAAGPAFAQAPRAPARVAAPPPPGIAPLPGRLVTTEDGACRLWVPSALVGPVSWAGGCRNAVAEGPGTATWRTEAGVVTITGTFRSGFLNGPGTRADPDGGRYEGEFVMTLAQGLGVYVVPNRMRYEGPFTNGAPNGVGRVAFSNGDRFVGGVQDGLGHGEGVYTWANGDRYEGMQRFGYPDGQGRFVSGGQVFEGTWDRGCFFGPGGTRIAIVRPMAECR